MFAPLLSHGKTELDVCSHCLTQFAGASLVFFVDSAHKLWALYDGAQYDVGFSLDVELDTDQLACIDGGDDHGNVVSWRHASHHSHVYYVRLAPDSFAEIESYCR